MSAPRYFPPFELKEGESVFIHWRKGVSEVEIQLRQPGTGGRLFTARATYPVDLFRRPPSTATGDWIRQELEDEFRTTRNTSRLPKRPRWKP